MSWRNIRPVALAATAALGALAALVMPTPTTAYFTDTAAMTSTFTTARASLIARTTNGGQTLVTNGYQAATIQDDYTTWEQTDPERQEIVTDVVPRFLTGASSIFYVSDGTQLYYRGLTWWTWVAGDTPRYYLTKPIMTAMATRHDPVLGNIGVATDGTTWWTSTDMHSWNGQLVTEPFPTKILDMSGNGISEDLWAIDRATGESVVWVSHDFGKTWEQTRDNPGADVQVIGNLDGSTAIAWGPNAGWKMTQVGGYDWLPVPDALNQIPGAFDIASGDDSRFMIVDRNQHVWRVDPFRSSTNLGDPYAVAP